MDVVEGLSVEPGRRDEPIDVAVAHRYELAAELCGGLRVADLRCGGGDGAEILARGTAAVTGVDPGEIAEFLGRDLTGTFDALVLLDGLERLGDPGGTLDRLVPHARAGLRLLISVPNGTALGEGGGAGSGVLDFDTANRALERFEGLEVLYQFSAEGSLIRSSAGGDLEGRVLLDGRGEPDYCDNLIAAVNFGAVGDARAWSRMQLGVAPANTRRILALERANRELWRANARLLRDHLGVADSAAASALERLRMRRRKRLARAVPGPLRPMALRVYRRLRGAGTRLRGDRAGDDGDRAR